MKLLIAFASFILLTNITVSAQLVKAIVVQLNTEQSKVIYFQKAGNNKEAEAVSVASMTMRKKMIADFNDNFKYCPVYYYIDTNVSLIKNKQFKGILLNADGTLAQAPIINSSDSDYLIACYGFPEDGTTIRSDKALIIYSDNFTQLYFFHRPQPDDNKLKYGFKSIKYDISYYPTAKEFDHRIGRVFSN